MTRRFHEMYQGKKISFNDTCHLTLTLHFLTKLPNIFLNFIMSKKNLSHDTWILFPISLNLFIWNSIYMYRKDKPSWICSHGKLNISSFIDKGNQDFCQIQTWFILHLTEYNYLFHLKCNSNLVFFHEHKRRHLRI